ncbi:anion permease [Carnimonas bestiolae]|uniref:anion permease n=1 Tax=Carnimonas bestiolae TaxID=3402172 RepID=UPI003EDCA668
MRRWLNMLIPVLCTVVLLLFDAPQGLSPQAWHFFAIFVGVIAGLILEPIPGGAVGLVAIVIISLTSRWTLFSPEQLASDHFNVPDESFSWAVSGFKNATVWLIFGAFMFATAYEKTHLGQRMALLLVKSLGRRTLLLGYAVALADLVLAPFTPSNTARSGGTVYPIISNLPALYGSKPNDKSSRLIGSYLMWVAITTTCVTSTMFMSALAPNILSVALVHDAIGLHISWGTWFIAAAPLGILLLVATPLLSYWLYPPGIKHNDEVPKWAADQLKELGSLSRNEILLLVLVCIALVLWIFGTAYVSPAMAALLVIAVMLITGVLEWSDITGNKAAWNTFFWFATLVALASGLSQVGFIHWLGREGGSLLHGSSPLTAIIVIVVAFYLLHYLFASTTAHTTALLPAALAIGHAVPGVDMQLLSMMLVASLGLMGIITPYGTGPSPIYFGSGFLPAADYWRLGTIFGALFLILLLAIGLPWMELVL